MMNLNINRKQKNGNQGVIIEEMSPHSSKHDLVPLN